MKEFSKKDIKIEITVEAKSQIKLIKQHDFTVENMVFRLKVDGKGCNGFDYALGFTDREEDDLEITIGEITMVMDPFTAYYAQEGKIDYIFDHQNNTEGFYFDNYNERKYKGKFFKNEEKLPPKGLLTD